MPIYSFDCADCGEELEIICRWDERDLARIHSEVEEESGCGGALVRCGVELPTVGEPSYEPGALMSDGSTVKGHFGKDARRKGGWHRP